MKLKKQQRFRLLPKAACEAVYTHYNDVEVWLRIVTYYERCSHR